MINITTYNVLAQSMSSTKFIKTDPVFLELSVRMPKILRELQACFDRRDIICLQEVDVTLAGAGLHQAFIANGYYPLTAHYSTMQGRDYFGNVIAFPIEKYNLIGYGQCKIGDHILVPEQYSNPIAPQPFNDGKPRTVTCDVYQEAAKRDTALLYASFEDKLSNKKFLVHTYHMPCAFWWPSVMTLHAEALLRKVKEVSNGLPYVLAGDFNTCPNTPVYKLITEGTINDKEFIPSSEWKHASVSPLADIRTLCGVPFLSTTCARNPSDSVFDEAIDHIFCSPDFSNHSMFYTPPSGEMPNSDYGSDHVPVSCTLTL